LCQAELNDLTTAKESFARVIEFEPEYAYAYYAMGLAYEKELNLEKCIENYEKFVEYSDDKNLKNNIQNKIDNLKKQLPQKEEQEAVVE
jgi:tetratricopeptide (TPR) repeat protein